LLSQARVFVVVEDLAVAAEKTPQELVWLRGTNVQPTVCLLYYLLPRHPHHSLVFQASVLEDGDAQEIPQELLQLRALEAGVEAA